MIYSNLDKAKGIQLILNSQRSRDILLCYRMSDQKFILESARQRVSRLSSEFNVPAPVIQQMLGLIYHA